MWKTKTAKKWRRGNFRVHNLKKKTLDNFVIGDRSKPFHIAFGSANFSATGKGERIGKLIKEKVGPEKFSLEHVVSQMFPTLRDTKYLKSLRR